MMNWQGSETDGAQKIGQADGRSGDGWFGFLHPELAPLGVPVIFITADYKRAGIEARNMATDVLIKPVGEVAVLRSVASVLNSRWERKAVG
jgi:hypothetical protein